MSRLETSLRTLLFNYAHLCATVHALVPRPSWSDSVYTRMHSYPSGAIPPSECGAHLLKKSALASN